MNRIETIIQKFDINPCTLSLPEAREYLYHLHEQSKPFKNKELSAEALKEFNDILERLKIIEIFYEALQKQDDSSWLDYDKLSYRLEQKPEGLDADELTVFQYYIRKKLQAGAMEAGLEKTTAGSQEHSESQKSLSLFITTPLHKGVFYFRRRKIIKGEHQLSKINFCF